MANIYTTEGEEITMGLQGSNVCDAAIQCARDIARSRGKAVVLDDNDGSYLVDPDGNLSLFSWGEDDQS